MKKIMMMVVCFVALSTSVFAASPEEVNVCRSMAIAAKSMMKARQSGMSVQDMLALVSRSSLPYATREKRRWIAAVAWSYPVYPLQSNKEDTIKRFHDLVFSRCVANLD